MSLCVSSSKTTRGQNLLSTANHDTVIGHVSTDLPHLLCVEQKWQLGWWTAGNRHSLVSHGKVTDNALAQRPWQCLFESEVTLLVHWKCAEVCIAISSFSF